VSSCSDKNSTLCDMWGTRQCDENPLAVFKECPSTCGVCEDTCVDKDTSCAQWAQAGECEANPITVGRACPKSCGLCSDLIGRIARPHKAEL